MEDWLLQCESCHDHRRQYVYFFSAVGEGGYAVAERLRVTIGFGTSGDYAYSPCANPNNGIAFTLDKKAEQPLRHPDKRILAPST